MWKAPLHQYLKRQIMFIFHIERPRTLYSLPVLKQNILLQIKPLQWTYNTSFNRIWTPNFKWNVCQIEVQRKFYLRQYVLFTNSTEVPVNSDIQNVLMDYVCVNQKEAQFLVEQHKLYNHSKNELESILKYLMRKQISMEQIKAYPWLLECPLYVLQKKFRLVEKYCKIKDDNILIMKLPLKQLETVLDQFKSYPDRLENLTYVSQNLNVTIDELLKSLKGRMVVLNTDLNRIKNIMKMLKSANIPTEAIIKDLWIFKHNEQLISKRLQKLLEFKNMPLKPWLLRCTNEALEYRIARFKMESKVLYPHSKTLQYLAQRLECTEEYILLVAEKYPKMLSVNPVKLEKILDLLFDNQFTSLQILHYPRILRHSLETLERRLADFKALNYRPASLTVLYQTKKKHDRLLKLLQARKKKESLKALIKD